MSELCQWRWLADHYGQYVWTNDPEPLYSRGGTGIVVARVLEVVRKKGRSGERMVLVRKVKKKGQNWLKIGDRLVPEGVVRGMVANNAMGEVVFESQAFAGSSSVLHRVAGTGEAIRIEDGGRVGRQGDVLKVTEGPGRPADPTQWHPACSWVFMTGSSDEVRYRVDGERNGVQFGEVEILSFDGTWKSLESNVYGKYLFSVPVGDFRMPRVMTFEQIITGVQSPVAV